MTQGVQDLINAIASGDSVAVETAFQAEMAARISDRLEVMRQDVAKSIFNEACKKKAMAEEDLEEDIEENLEEDEAGHQTSKEWNEHA